MLFYKIIVLLILIFFFTSEKSHNSCKIHHHNIGNIIALRSCPSHICFLNVTLDSYTTIHLSSDTQFLYTNSFQTYVKSHQIIY